MSVANQGQAANWNEVAGPIWVEMQPVLDELFAPLEPILLDVAFPGAGGRVVDIGCGAGATTMAMASRVGTGGACLGLDISAPLVDLAASRAADRGIANTTFVVGDAQTHRFEPATFAAAMSRFGVMFFDDPVAAFANIRSGVVAGGKLAALAWRSPRDNPFMTAATRAARPYLSDLPSFEPNAPGQFGFADENYVRSVLDQSGWRSVAIRPVDVECTMPLASLDAYIMNMGPVGAALRKLEPAQFDEVAPVVRNAFAPYVVGDRVRFTIACWLVTASA